MGIYRDEVAVLKVKDYGEGDRILTLFGRRRGKFAVIAKGIRKLTSRKRGHLETFSLARVSCAEGKNLDIITEAESYFFLNPDILSAGEFERVGLAGLVLDKFLPENVAEPKLYERWEKYLRGKHDETATSGFVVQTLVGLGFIQPAKYDGVKQYSKLKALVFEILGRM